jgi:antirestriction protein ArdC
VPTPDAFFEPINWHRAALHELGHWTGHPTRLARDLSGSFGSKSYGQEELCAEMASAFVSSLGVGRLQGKGCRRGNQISN